MNDAKPRKRPRYSLLALLGLMTLTAFIYTVWGETKRYLPLKREVESLRSEVGMVAVAEPSKLYVQPLDDSFDSRLQFRWRVYVPPERKARVVVEIQQPRYNWLGHLSMALESGETGFELVAMPPIISDVTTAWQYKLRQPMSGRSNGVSGPRPPWVNDELASGGMAFEDFDPSQGAAEGNTLTLMDLAASSPETPTRIVVRVKHYPQGQSPASNGSARQSKLTRSPRVETDRAELER